MSNIYEQFAKDDANNIIEKAPSQNIGNDLNLNPPTFNVYEELIQQEQEQEDLQVKKSLQAVMKKDPNMVAEGLQLANELGLNKNFALDSDEAIRLLKERKRMKFVEDLQYAKKNPVLYKQLTDPKFAALAYDNLPNLANSENLWDSLISIPENGWQGIRKGVLSREKGKIANRLRSNQVKFINTQDGFDLDYVPTEQDKKDLERLKEIDEIIANYDADGVGLVEGSGYFFGQYGSSIPEAAIAGLATYKAKLVAGAALGAALGGGTENSLLGRFVGGSGGATVGNVIGLFTGWNAFQNKLALDTFQIEGGHSWLELRQSGASMEDARIASNAVGTANALIEKVGLNIIANPYAKALTGVKGSFARSGLAKTPFFKALEKRISRQVVKNVLGKNGKKLTWNGIAREFAKDYGILLSTESIQEVLQEAVAISAVNLTAKFSEDDIQTISPEDTTDRLLATFQETFKSMILFGLIGPSVTYSTNLSKAEKAKNNTAVLKKITEIAKDDVTKKRNKEQYKDYEQLLGDKAGISDFYFNAQTFQQELDNNNISDEQLELFSPELAKELKDARKEGFVGKVVKIPTGKYISEVSGTELGNSLFPHLKPGEGEFSQTEMVQFYKDQPELFAAVKQEFDVKKLALQQFTKESRAVKKQIKKRLIDLGFSESESRDMAALPQAVATAFSKSLGITPLEFMNRFQYNIETEGTNISTFNKQFFNQDGTIKTETELFKNWFRKSKLTNPDGTPQVMYHGTLDSFDYFDLNHPNRYDSGFAGTGIYLTPDKKLAKVYTKNKANKGTGEPKIMELYARLENPKIENINIKPQMKRGGRAAADGFRDKLIAEGHDGVILQSDTGEVVEVVVFDVNGVKSVDNNGNWSNEINNIYQQQPLEFFEQKTKQKQGKPVPQAVYQIARIVENFDFAKSKPFATNRQFKLEIQNRVKNEAKKAGVDLSKSTIERDKYLVQTLLDDARFALQENANAVGWYNEKVTKAMKVVSLVYPKIATDTEHSFAFKWALAATSNGIDVNTNFRYASAAYEYFDQNGKLPESFPEGGQSRLAMEISFQTINDLIEEKGFAEVEQFMKTKHTRREVEAFTGKEVTGGFGMDEMVYGSAIIGPKIGNGFFANLYGNYEQLTLDRWAMRTWGRMTGTLVNDKTKQAKIKREHIKQIIRSLSKEQKKAFESIIKRKLTLGDIDAIAIAIEKATTKPANRAAMMQIATFTEDAKNKQIFIDIMGQPKKGDKTISLGDLLRKRGNGLAKDLDGQKEVVSGAPERRNVEKVFTQVLNILQQDVKDLTMSDLQALVWYPEKKLYDSAKLKEAVVETGYEDNAAPDYANAAVDFAARLGVSDADIQSALQEVDNDLSVQSEERTTGTQRDDGGSIPVRTDSETFQQQGREDANIDEGTGLPLNPDGTVTVYHHTSRRNAERIRATGELRSAGEPDVYVTTRAITDTGYGDTAVTIRVEPSRLSLDDEFPNGRRDYRLSVGKPRGSIRVNVGEFLEQRRDSKGPKGRFDPKSFTTLINQESDISTFFHETGHYMLSVMEDIVMQPDAPADMVNDFNVLLDFWGVEDMETWSKFTIEEKKQYHEAFALNFEIYLHEGKVPNNDSRMRRIFRDFVRYLGEVYENIKYELNTQYKKLFGKDLPVLTDEVKSVMDRMLATNQNILLANEIYGMKAMFLTKEQSGMTDAEWTDYQARLQEAFDESKEILNQKSMKQLEWLDNARSKYMANLQKKHKKTYKKVEAEVTQEVQNEKIYRLINYLKRGETLNDKGEIVKVQSGYKLSIESVKQLVPFHDMKYEMQQLGYGKSGMVAKEGQSVEDVADLFEYANGLDMIDAILSARKIEEVIKERTEQRMLEEYSELVDERLIELGVLEALHNEARSRFISLELKFLSKSTQPVRLQVAAAREAALDILAKRKLQDIKPSEYTRDEENARKEAEDAISKGDEQRAVEAKRAQLIANQLAKEAIEIHKNYDKAIKKFDKFLQTDQKFRDKNKKYKRNMFLIDAGRAILYSFGIGKKKINVTEKMNQIKEYNPFTYEQLQPIIEKAGRKRTQTDLLSLTSDEFLNLEETLDFLWHQSLRDEQIRQGNKLIAFEEARDPLLKILDKNISRSPQARERLANPPGKREAVKTTFKSKLHKFVLTLGSNLQRMESFTDLMDGADEVVKGVGSAVLQLKGGKLGAFYNTLYYPIKEALNEYRQQQVVITKEYTDLVAALDFGNKESKITAYEFDEVSEDSDAYTFGTDSDGLGKVELLGAMLHTGNKSNLKKLLLGRGWGSLNEDGTLNTTHWDNFVQRMKDEGILTQSDYVFLQAVWDLNQKMLPLLQKAHRELNGFYFKVVEATPIVNEFGTFRGGYVPAKGDPNMTKQEVEITVEQLQREFRMSLPMVEHGMTKERNENFAQPLSLNLGYMTKHIDDTLRYSYVQPVVKDVLKIVNDKEFQKKLEILNPQKTDTLIKPWLQTVVSQKTFAPSGMGAEFDTALNATRKRGGMAVMFFNLKNAIEQYTGVFPAMLKATPVQMLSSLQNYIADREGTMQAIADLSPFMADRQLNQIFDIQSRLQELIVNPNNFEKFKDWSTKHAYFLQQTFQNQVDAVVWMAVYNQTHQKLPSSMSDIEVQTEAIKQADAAVRMTQDSLLPEDRAGFQNWNPIIQSISQFTGYFNNIANLNNNQYQKITRDIGFNNKGKGTEQLFYMYFYSIMMPAVIAGMIGRTFAGNLFLDEEDDGMIVDDMMKAVLGDLVNYKKAFVPIFGNALLIPINQFDDKPWNDNLVSSPSLELLVRGSQTAFKLPVDLIEGKGISGRQVRDISALVTIFSGIPITPLGKSSGYLIDVGTGKVNPENAMDLIRGTLTGKASKASRGL